MKKVFLSVIIFVLMLPFSALAKSGDVGTFGAGVWDTIYNKSLNVTSSGVYTSVFTSGGGDIRLCVNGINAGNKISYQFINTNSGAILPVMIDDNTAGSSTVTAEVCFGKIDARSYVGSDGKAYFYVKAIGVKSSDTVQIRVED